MNNFEISVPNYLYDLLHVRNTQMDIVAVIPNYHLFTDLHFSNAIIDPMTSTVVVTSPLSYCVYACLF
jgi:hypothetical protein